MGSRSNWDEDDEFPVEEWRYEVNNDDTRLGYWDWVDIQRTLKEEDYA